MLRMNDRQREMENIKKYFIEHIQKPNQDAEQACEQELEIALLRMTEKKLSAEQKFKEYELELHIKDERIKQLEALLLK